MTDGVTYAGALAACVARLGEPASSVAPALIGPCAYWRHGPSLWSACVSLGENMRRGTVRMAAFHEGSLQPAWQRTLAGEPTADAPAATLPDALDAADRWLRERAPTKGQ